MVKLTKSERNKLEKAVRKKHGNLKVISDMSKLSYNTIKTAYRGNEVSVETYATIKNILPELASLN